MKTTVLHPCHLALNAKMAPFGGYDMPIQYNKTGIIKEHEATRAGAAVFDTCHMGEFRISGNDAIIGLERILSCDVADLRIGSCRYGYLCNENGGVIDDLIVYRIAENVFMTVVNAATEEGDFEWMRNHLLNGDIVIDNISSATAKIDVHGQKSPKIVASLLKNPIDGLKYFGFADNFYGDSEVMVSRTGYTGEIGFEIYCHSGVAVNIWNDCVSLGAVPAGLGARDTLRIEMGYPLYGSELSENRNAASAGFARAISNKKEFVGSAAIAGMSANGQILRGIRLDSRRAARHGDVVLVNGEIIGTVTSGSFSPTLGYAVALCYVNGEFGADDTFVTINSGKSELIGKICKLPFYKNGTARADIKLYL